MAREITYLSDVYLITCVVESGLANKIVDAATNVGAQGATINKEQSNRIFEAMYLAGNLDTPGKGIMWMVKLDRVATHIPKDVMKRVKGQK